MFLPLTLLFLLSRQHNLTRYKGHTRYQFGAYNLEL